MCAISNRWAVLIGVNDYEDKQIPHLRFAERDAQELARILEERCGFITRCLIGAEATRSRILELLSEGRIAADLPPMKKSDQFLLLFAGHGQLVSGSYVLHPFDAKWDRFSNSLMVRDLSSIIRSDIPCRECMCVLDACRNQPGARGAPVFDVDSSRDIRAMSRDTRNKIVEVLFGCNEGQQSWEDSRLEHGLLTYHLIQTLDEPRASQGLTFEMLADRAGDLMGAWLQDTRPDVYQEPYLYRRPTERKIELISPSINVSIVEQPDREKSKVKEKVKLPSSRRVRREIRAWIRDKDGKWSRVQWEEFQQNLYESEVALGFKPSELVSWRDEEKRSWLEEKKRQLEAERLRIKKEQERAKKLRRIEEEKLWLQIQDSPSEHLCRDYLGRFGNGRFVDKVQGILRELEEEQLWNEIEESPAVSLCRDYQARFSNGKYAHKVKAVLDRLKEKELWHKIHESPTVVLYEDYLARFPNGRFASDVQKSLIVLRKKVEITQTQSFKESCLVIAAENEIYVWNEEMGEPRRIASRKKYIRAICSHNGELYDVQDSGAWSNKGSKIYQTLTNQELVRTHNRGPISLLSIDGTLYHIDRGTVVDTFKGEKKTHTKYEVSQICKHKGALYYTTTEHGVRNYHTGRKVDAINILKKIMYTDVALCSHNGKLYHSSARMIFSGSIVYETLTGKEVATRDSDVYTLCSYNGKLYDGGKYKKVCDTFANREVLRFNAPVRRMISVEGALARKLLSSKIK